MTVIINILRHVRHICMNNCAHAQTSVYQALFSPPTQKSLGTRLTLRQQISLTGYWVHQSYHLCSSVHECCPQFELTAAETQDDDNVATWHNLLVYAPLLCSSVHRWDHRSWPSACCEVHQSFCSTWSPEHYQHHQHCIVNHELEQNQHVYNVISPSSSSLLPQCLNLLWNTDTWLHERVHAHTHTHTHTTPFQVHHFWTQNAQSVS